MGSPLSIDLHRFELSYSMLDGERAAGCRLFALKSGVSYPNPFNTEETPFLIPFDVGKFGYNVYVKSAVSKSVWWSAKTEFIDADQNVIPTKGYSGQVYFPFVEGLVGNASKPTLDPGKEDGAGFTPIYAAPPVPGESPSAREFLWQTAELGQNNPVRMRVTVSARSSFVYPPTPANVIPDTAPITNPPPNVVEVWIKCV